MKELVVLSGKGGTGKTSLVAALATLANDSVLADCDVDAADLHLLVRPSVIQTSDFSGGKRAVLDPDRCTGCGICAQYCRFDAVSSVVGTDGEAKEVFEIDPIRCEGCSVCAEMCPSDAIRLEDCVNGQWFISGTRFGPMVHAKLGIAEENSGKLVTLLRREAKKLATQENYSLIIVDGSPGIGCPVIASMTGADLALLVTEPTLSGKHDLARVADLADSLRVPALVCINKADINAEIAGQIEDEAASRGLKIAAKVDYDEAFTKAQILASSVIEYTGAAISQQMKALWRKVVYALG
jgi:MinD superfamily P-loop ATPase